MSETPKPIDRKALTQKTVDAFGAVLGIVLASGAFAGQPAEQPPVPEKTVQVDTSPSGIEAPMLTPEEKRENALKTYLTSEKRDKKLEHITNALGRRIMKAAHSGKLGSFNAYNPKTNEWASRNPKTSGWVYYQHNPQDGGADNQYSLTVYRKPNGTYDLDKGIKAVSIIPDSYKKGSIGVEFSAPGKGILGSGSDQYTVASIDKHELLKTKKDDTKADWYERVGDHYNTTAKSVEEAVAVEEAADNIADELLKNDHVS